MFMWRSKKREVLSSPRGSRAVGESPGRGEGRLDGVKKQGLVGERPWKGLLIRGQLPQKTKKKNDLIGAESRGKAVAKDWRH